MSLANDSRTYLKQKFNDFGLGGKATSGQYRILKKDGSFNVRKKNVPFFERFNFYHSLVSMSWTKFLIIVLATYFSINLLFATIYVSIGIEHLTGIRGETVEHQFMEAFFFSAQTITTLGYGQVAPIGLLANIVAAVESMLGLLGFALATGMVYGRFSKPSAHLSYSENATIAPYQDINGFMFRVVNPRGNQLLEVEATVSLSVLRKDSALRDYYSLELERSKVVFLPASWTIVHPITDDSPFKLLSAKELEEQDMEVLVVIKAFDETFSQTVYSRSSYKYEELKWGEKFTYLLSQEDGSLIVDVSAINSTEKAPLN